MAKPATKAKAAPTATVEIFDGFEQRSDEWRQVRCGLMTASNFGTIMSRGKDGGEGETRRALLHTLAGELLTGEPAEERFTNRALQRGIDMEPEARDYYARTNFVTLRSVAFIKRTLPNGVVIGCSPDSLVDHNGALEIKTTMPALIIPMILGGASAFPTKHRPQLQGTLWVADLEWIDLMFFYRGMPVAPRFRVFRDDKYIREISDAIEVFDYELKKIVDQCRKAGG